MTSFISRYVYIILRDGTQSQWGLRMAEKGWPSDLEVSCENIEYARKVLNNHAPIKTKYLRANNPPFLIKELGKANMLRSKLRNQYLVCKF